MVKQQDIAIIGLSGIFPQARDIGEFHQNLRNRVDSVREIPEERKLNSCLDAARDYQVAGCLNRIDEFDHKFFNISLKEAEYMDPQQRMALELACGAIENAGYSLRELRGSRAAVILGNPINSYYKLFKQFDPTALTGNMPAGLAGRISYTLDLRGPAMTIDTACSSSLVAIHEGCQKLLAGEVDYVLAGGISLYIFFPERQDGAVGVGILSPDGRSKTFDAAANGTGAGEGGGIVLLKLLSDALAHRNHIHAVIKGSAINQDGGRSNGITAPSPSAQSEVMLAAWQRAGIEPRTISYIEAHGTGTKLGDPIEIQGLTDAFRASTDEQGFCAIGSVKTNIGHLDSAAGVAGLIKVILSLKHRELFASLHFNRPNPFIDFERTAVYVNTKLRPWDALGGVRRAGVSSFGLSGTNAHAVLEEAPPAVSVQAERADETAAAAGQCLVTISAKTPLALRLYLQRLIDYLSSTTRSIAEISYTLNRGRDDYAHRHACVVNSKEQLLEDLQSTLYGIAEQEPQARQPERPVVFLFSDDARAESAMAERLAARYPPFRETLDSCLHLAQGLEPSSELESFIFQHALYRLCQSLGVTTNRIIGAGLGNIVTAVATGRLNLEEGIRDAALAREKEWSFNLEKLKEVVTGLSKNSAPVFVEMGRDGLLSREIKKLDGAPETLSVIALLDDSPEPDLLHALAAFYLNHGSIDWAKFYEGRELQRIELPTYPFEKTRCWVTEIRQIRASEPAISEAPELRPAPDLSSTRLPAGAADEEGLSTQERLLAIWRDVLKVESPSPQDDYFDLGGNSLISTQITNRIEQSFGVKMEFEAFYDYPTAELLAKHIDELRAEATASETDAATREEIIKMLAEADDGYVAGLLDEVLGEAEDAGAEK